MRNIEILYDHYKDSFAQQKEFLKKRDLYTYILLGLILLFSFQLHEKEISKSIIVHFLNQYIGDVEIQFTYINTIINVVYLLVMMSYYQVNLNIERLYPYIHKIEDALSEEDFKIEREGLNYLRSYPWMLWWVHRIYQWGLPMGLMVVALAQILDFSQLEWGWYNVLNILIFSVAIILSMLYLSYIHFHEEYFDKQQYPKLKFSERMKHYIVGEEKKSQ